MCPEFCSPASGAAFLTPAELVKHRGQLPSFVAVESRQQPDVATADSVAGEPASRVSPLPHKHFLIPPLLHPPPPPSLCVIFKGAKLRGDTD